MLESGDGICQNITIVNAVRLFLVLRMPLTQHPADVCEEEAASRVVRVAVRVAEFVMRSATVWVENSDCIILHPHRWKRAQL